MALVLILEMLQGPACLVGLRLPEQVQGRLQDTNLYGRFAELFRCMQCMIVKGSSKLPVFACCICRIRQKTSSSRLAKLP